MKDLLGRLRDRATSGEPLTIIYDDDGAEGVVMRVSPVHVVEGRLLARDLEHGGLMSLRLEEIQAVEGLARQTGEPPAKGDRLPLPAVAGCVEVAFLERLGWHVVVDESAIALHRRLEDGRPSRRPDVAITGIARGDAHGYRVHGPSLSGGRVFARITDAIHAFAEEAVGQAPTPGGGGS